jgi:hypothetical protein
VSSDTTKYAHTDDGDPGRLLHSRNTTCRRTTRLSLAAQRYMVQQKWQDIERQFEEMKQRRQKSPLSASTILTMSAEAIKLTYQLGAAASATPGLQANTSYHSSITPGPPVAQAGISIPLAKVRLFLEVRRPCNETAGCWSIGLDEMDIFTGERLRTQLLVGDALERGERVLRAQIKPEPHHDNYTGPSVSNVQLRFTAFADRAFADREQTDWMEMVKGLETFYSKNPSAAVLKLRATLVVGEM